MTPRPADGPGAAVTGPSPAVPDPPAPSVLSVRDAGVRLGGRTLWDHLDLDVAPGELVTILGANGTGKTTLFRAILGQQALSRGEIRLEGERVHRGDRRIGFVPQQRIFAASVPMRGRDLVAFGRTGTRFGPPISTATDRAAIAAAIHAAGGEALANRPIGSLSGGEQQRLRMAQAIVSAPRLLLCDEPLSSLDLGNQRAIVELIEAERARGAAVLVVTHDINPLLELTDRILYLAPGGHRVGAPDEVLRSEVLSRLYGTAVDVVRVQGRVLVIGDPDTAHHDHAHGHPDEPAGAP